MTALVGIDPGFASLGLARVELAGDGETVTRLGVLRSKPSSRKRGVLATEDNVRRLVELAAGLGEWIAPDVVALCCESQSWPRSASAATKVGMAWGLVGAVAQRHGLPVLQASPQEIKRAVCGGTTASKAEVQAALERRYGALPLPPQRTLHEHAADALAAVVACLNAPTVLLARRMEGAA